MGDRKTLGAVNRLILHRQPTTPAG